jgi:hypothetical protein
MSTAHDIRQAALDAGWTIKGRVGEPQPNHRGMGRWDRDLFVIGRVERHLADGTPVVEAEHEISVTYRRDGAVRTAHGITFTVPAVLYHTGIHSTVGETDKAARIVAALSARTSEIPAAVHA